MISKSTDTKNTNKQLKDDNSDDDSIFLEMERIPMLSRSRRLAYLMKYIVAMLIILGLAAGSFYLIKRFIY